MNSTTALWFLAWLYESTDVTGDHASKILSAVTSIFLNKGVIFTRSPTLQALVKGFRALRFKPKRIRKPWSLYHNILFRRHVLDPNDLDSMASATAIIALGWGGLMRPGEIGMASGGHLLTRGQVQFISDSRGRVTTAIITLYKSKTNKGRRPDKIYISCLCQQRFCGHQVVCPAHILSRYVRIRDRFFPKTKTPRAPLLLRSNGRCVSYRDIGRWIRLAIQVFNETTQFRLEPLHYAGHSLRLGGCTDRARNGDAGHMIETLGRWSSLTWKKVYIDLDWQDIILLSGKSARQLQKMAINPFTVTASRGH